MNWILVGIVLTTFVVLGSSRITTRIKAVAIQGGLLSVLQFVARGSLFDIHGALLFGITFFIKTIIIPLLIFRSIRGISMRVDKEPKVSSHSLLLTLGLITTISFLNINTFPLAVGATISSLLIPSALTTVLTGLLILVTKTKATNQIIGFLILENGVFTFGMTIVSEFPTIVEVGVLLDILVGVFIMGIMIYQINRTFDDIDTKSLSLLGDA
ncbi:MAG: hydrogenase [Deltaproteobacteria bacterium]|nr:hydrogenase [Deltaproteobacteria bacterium]